MKRARRERALGQLYSGLDGEDYDAREFAMFQLALLLRRANESLSSGDWTDQDVEHLSRDLLRVRLSKADMAGAVSRLARVAARHAGSRATALWAMGEAPAQFGLPGVLQVIHVYGEGLSEEAAFQVCRALRAWLEAGRLDNDPVRDALVEHSLLGWLTRWSRSADRRLASSADEVIRALRSLCD